MHEEKLHLKIAESSLKSRHMEDLAQMQKLFNQERAAAEQTRLAELELRLKKQDDAKERQKLLDGLGGGEVFETQKHAAQSSGHVGRALARHRSADGRCSRLQQWWCRRTWACRANRTTRRPCASWSGTRRRCALSLSASSWLVSRAVASIVTVMQELEAKTLELKLREQSQQKSAELSALSDKLNRSAAERENLKSEMDALQQLVRPPHHEPDTPNRRCRSTSSRSSWRRCRGRC